MSNVKETVKRIEMEKGFEEQIELKKLTVSCRVDEEEAFRLDLVAKRLGYTRSAMVAILLNEAVLDAAEEFGLSLDELRCMFIAERTGRDIEEVRKDWKKSGIFLTTEGGETVNITPFINSGGK